MASQIRLEGNEFQNELVPLGITKKDAKRLMEQMGRRRAFIASLRVDGELCAVLVLSIAQQRRQGGKQVVFSAFIAPLFLNLSGVDVVSLESLCKMLSSTAYREGVAEVSFDAQLC